MTRRKQHIGSHSRNSHRWDKPVSLMRGRRERVTTPDGYSYMVGWTSRDRQIEKRMHNRKVRRWPIEVDP